MIEKNQFRTKESIQLTEDQEKELQESYLESFDESNLIDLETLKDKHSHWLNG
ncbi:MAG: hypothetical protein R8G66_07290 [Cytophagales bacterium]|nr:hypothetical protein [Cytophagales bacterium]